MKKPFELFTGPGGEVSSKRVAGLACIISGIIYSFVKPTADPAILGALFGTGLALLGISAITKT